MGFIYLRVLLRTHNVPTEIKQQTVIIDGTTRSTIPRVNQIRRKRCVWWTARFSANRFFTKTISINRKINKRSFETNASSG